MSGSGPSNETPRERIERKLAANANRPTAESVLAVTTAEGTEAAVGHIRKVVAKSKVTVAAATPPSSRKK